MLHAHHRVLAAVLLLLAGSVVSWLSCAGVGLDLVERARTWWRSWRERRRPTGVLVQLEGRPEPLELEEPRRPLRLVSGGRRRAS